MVSLPHAVAVWRRNATMYGRTWMWNILPNFFEPVLYLLSIGIGVGAYINQMGGTSYAGFLAPGLVCVSAMNGASFEVTYNIFVRLNFEKQYDAMLTTPILALNLTLVTRGLAGGRGPAGVGGGGAGCGFGSASAASIAPSASTTPPVTVTPAIPEAGFAPALSACTTCDGVAPGSTERTRAATPET